MRLGKAIGLDRANAGLGDGVLTIRSTKSGRDRLVPLHPTVTSALAGYARRRDQPVPGPGYHPVLRLRRRHAGPGKTRRAGICAAHRRAEPAHRGPPAPDPRRSAT